ncbi:MAG: hypothetical protein WB565_00705 [Acidimicrobiales bacterium]
MQVRNDLASFFRCLREQLGGRAIPYVWVVEWHKTDHGLHAHFAVDRYVKRSFIERSWPHGFVHIQLIGDLPVGSGVIGESRRTAAYLAKYISKAFDDRRIPGLHRYEVAQGFQPRREIFEAALMEDVVAMASDRMGARPSEVTTSETWANWTGPTAVAARWS